jgi:hypothetical protein
MRAEGELCLALGSVIRMTPSCLVDMLRLPFEGRYTMILFLYIALLVLPGYVFSLAIMNLASALILCFSLVPILPLSGPVLETLFRAFDIRKVSRGPLILTLAALIRSLPMIPCITAVWFTSRGLVNAALCAHVFTLGCLTLLDWVIGIKRNVSRPD